MNPFPIYREGFRPLEDIKKGFSLLDTAGEIRLGDSLPGRISEGEALLHPAIFEVLKLIRARFPKNVLHVPTNAVVLTNDFIEKLKEYKPLKLTVSYHSDNPKNWCKIFQLGKDKYKIARAALFHLLKGEFFIEGALVPLPNLVGYDDIENTIKTLRIFTKKVIVYPPGYSRKASSRLKKILDTNYADLSRFLIKMRKKYELDLELETDLLMPLPFYPLPVMRETFYSGFKNVLWPFAEVAYEKAGGTLEELNSFVPNEHHSCRVRNTTYKGNIICSGLLMVSDYRKAIKDALRKLKKNGVKIDLIILPKAPFDRYGDDLKGENYSIIGEEFGIPTWIRT